VDVTYDPRKPWQLKESKPQPAVFDPYIQRIEELVHLVRSGDNDEKVEATKALSKIGQASDVDRKTIIRIGGAQAIKERIMRGTESRCGMGAVGPRVRSGIQVVHNVRGRDLAKRREGLRGLSKQTRRYSQLHSQAASHSAPHPFTATF
jgi:hypothetical protein